MDKLQAHLQYAMTHNQEANTSFARLEAASQVATQLKETALKQVVSEASDLSQINDGHVTVLKEIME